MDLDAVYQALSDAVSVIEGLNCLPYVPDSVPEPCFYVGELDIDPLQTFGTDDGVTIKCRVLVSRADDRNAQKNLNAYLRRTGPTSIRAALEAAAGAPGELALGGAADDLVVRRIQGHRLYTFGESTYLGAEFTVFVIGDEE